MSHPDPVQKHLKQVVDLIKQNRLKEARSHLRFLLQQHPNVADAWYLASFTVEESAQQIKILHQALQINPEHTQAKARLAKLSAAESPIASVEAAIESVEAAIEAGEAEPPVAEPAQNPTSASPVSRMAAYRTPAVHIGVVVIGLVLLLSFITRPALVNMSPTATVAPATVIVTRASLVPPTEAEFTPLPPPTLVTLSSDINTATAVAAQVTYSPGERIVFFDSDTLFMVKPDRTEQMVVFKSGDDTFEDDRLQFTALRRVIWSPTGNAYAYRPLHDEYTRIFDPFTQKAARVQQTDGLSWSPDGTQMVITYFSRESRIQQLALVTADGSQPMQITSSAVSAEDPAWSPDGQRIAFVRSEYFEEHIYTIRPDGSDEMPLTVGMNPVWSPDGQSILFYRDEPGKTGSMYRINADGTDVVKIAPAPSPDRTYPVYKWSPDGRKIAHLVPRFNGTSYDNTTLVVTSADGSETLWSYNLVTGAYVADYVWSPDSTRLLMLNDSDLVMVDLTTGTVELFIPGRGTEPDSIQRHLGANFAWLSADQAATAIAGLQQPRRIVTLDSNVTPTPLLTVPPAATLQLQPTITLTYTPLPDGFVTFTPTPFGGEDTGGGNGKVVISEYDGMNRTFSYYEFDLRSRTKTPLPIPDTIRQLISHPDGRYYVATYTFREVTRPVLVNKTDFTIAFIPGIEQGHSAAPSPDGNYIAYIAPDTITKIPRVWVAGIDGSNPHPVDNPSLKTKSTRGNPAYSPYNPRWSTDGKRISYYHTIEGLPQIWMIDLETMTDELVFRGENLEWSPDGKSLAFMGRGDSMSVYDGLETGQSSNIHIADADGRNVRLFPVAAGSNFVWSPDSQHLIFDMPVRPYETRSLYIANADGSELALLVSAEGGSVGIVEWEAKADTALPIVTPRATLPPLATVTLTPTPGPSPTLRPGGGTGKILYGSQYNSPTVGELDVSTQTERYLSLPSSIAQVMYYPDPRYLFGTYNQRVGNGASQTTIIKPALFDAQTGAILPILHIERGEDVTLSPDGSQFAYVVPNPEKQAQQLWIANIDGTNSQAISDPAQWARNPAWSPDGTRIAYTSSFQIRVINLATRAEQVVVESGDDAAWSPDSRQIAYIAMYRDPQYNSNSIMSYNLHIVNADGSQPHPLTPDTVRDNSPEWSPDGSQIVFSRMDGIYMINADGTNLTQVKRNNGGTNFSWQTFPDSSSPTLIPPVTPTISPTPVLSLGGGGGTILFTRNNTDIYELDLKTRNITERPVSPSIQQLTASGSKEYFAGTYREEVDGKTDAILKPALIRRYNITVVTVIPNIERGYSASLSPDGSKVAYIAEDAEKEIQWISIANIDGTDIRQVSDSRSKSPYPGTNFYFRAPVWSPDGTRILYATSSVSAEYKNEIHIVDLRTMTDSLIGEQGESPAWSPDGQRIAYTATDERQKIGISIVNADGTNPRSLTTGADADPAWSPDGTQLVFGRHSDIYIVGADGTGLAYVQQTFGSPPLNFVWMPVRDLSLPTLTPTPTMTPTPTFTASPTLGFGGSAGKLFFNEGGSYYRLDLTTFTKTYIELPPSVSDIIPHPDGKYFVGMYSYPANTGVTIHKPVLVNRSDLSVSPIPNIAEGYDIALSPDGSQIAYVVTDRSTSDDQLWIASLDGTNIRQINDPTVKLYSGETYVAAPVWSPDGKHIAYSAGLSLRIVDLDTFTDRFLVESRRSAAWSPDGRRIAYVIQEEFNGPSNLGIVNADGSNPRAITRTSYQYHDWFWDNLLWSPDGSYIVFSWGQGIYKLSPEGTDFRPILSPAGYTPFGFTWEMPVNPSAPTLTPRPELPLLTTFTPAPTFTVTPTATPYPTDTPSPTWTPSPTYTPWYVFTPTPDGIAQQSTSTPAALDMRGPKTGRAVLQITSANPDAILLKGIPLTEGEFTLAGRAEINFIDFSGVRIDLNLRPENASRDMAWAFRFHAPDLLIGPVYQTDPNQAFDTPEKPGLSMSPAGVDTTACNRVQGAFQIESIAPHLIISFTHICNQNPAQEIRGRIVFDFDANNR